MKKIIIVLILALSGIVHAQQVNVLFEDFNNGFPKDWTHYSALWGGERFAVVDSALKEASGGFFVPATRSIELPMVDLTTVSSPFLEFEMAIAKTNPHIQFSVQYTTDSIWHSLISFTDTTAPIPVHTSWDNSWAPIPTDYQTISIDLTPVANDSNVRLSFVYGYLNAHGSGVWFIDDVRIFGNATIGIPEVVEPLSFDLFPNPASGIVSISHSSGLKNSMLKITSITGELILEKNLASAAEELDISYYPAGIYLVHYTQGNQTVSRKLIVD